MKYTILLFSVFWLSACVESSIVVGQPGPALVSEEVEMYYIQRPRCNFETVAHIRVSVVVAGRIENRHRFKFPFSSRVCPSLLFLGTVGHQLVAVATDPLLER